MVEGNSNGENSYTSVLTFESHIHGSGILVYNWALPEQTRFLLCWYNILYLHTQSHAFIIKKRKKKRNPHAYAGRRWKLSRSSCSNKQYVLLCLDKIFGTSFHANNARGMFFLSTLKNWNNVCLKICMAFSSWERWRTKRNIENKKGKRSLANILSFLSVFCSQPAIWKNPSHDTRSDLSYMHVHMTNPPERQ